MIDPDIQDGTLPNGSGETKITSGSVDEAARLAKLGFAVFPVWAPNFKASAMAEGRPCCTCHKGFACESPGKHPVEKGWQASATKDPEEAKQLFSKYPGANIGIAMGAASGCFGLDVDPRHGGHYSLEGLEAQHGPVPESLSAQTGGGGFHHYFKLPLGLVIKNKVAIAPGLDIRSTGGLFVAPPSRHTSGNGYSWYDGEPEETPLAEAPAWLLDLISSRGAPSKKVQAARMELPEKIEAGGRNDFLYRFACSLRHYGAGPIEILATLTIINDSRCSPPLKGDELAKLVDGACKFDPGARSKGASKRARAQAARDEAQKIRALPWLSNFTQMDSVGPNGEACSVQLAKPLKEIVREIHQSRFGWPCAVGTSGAGILFAPTEGDSTIESPSVVRMLSTEAALSGWLHGFGLIEWLTGLCGNGITVSRRELAEGLLHCAPVRYQGVELLPHEPPLPGTYYAGVELPKSDGSALAELRSHLNGDMATDVDLLVAALLTPGWGGAPGSRPCFVLASPHGRGSGKTATAELLAACWGGCVGVNPDDRDDLGRLKSRLLDDSALAKRVVLLDNLKNELGNAELEGLITCQEISGKRMYSGNFSRPNTLTCYLTANTPSLSRDLATRSVLINVGAQRHASDFAEWSAGFMRDRRGALISDCLAMLRGPKRCELEARNLDRWARWQRAILELFENGNELAEAIAERRPVMDVDLETSADVMQALRELLEEAYLPDARGNLMKVIWGDESRDPKDRGLLLDTMHTRFPVGVLTAKLRATWGLPKLSAKGLDLRLKSLCGVGDLSRHFMKDPSRTYGRRWIWRGEVVSAFATPLELRWPRWEEAAEQQPVLGRFKDASRTLSGDDF